MRPTAIGPSDSAQEREAGEVEAGAVPAAPRPDPAAASMILQRQPADASQATPPRTPAVPATGPGACDETKLTETTDEALALLQDVIGQLVNAGGTSR